MKFDVIQHEQTPNTPAISNVSEFIKENEFKIAEFKNFAISKNNAIGLAANQCSIDDERFNVRMVAVKDIKTKECIIAIDPKITKYYGIKRKRAEGCLTWGFNGKHHVILADRYHFVDVEYYTPDGSFHQETHKGFQAQVWQHELNHINGIPEEVINESFVLEDPIDIKTERNDTCPCGSGKKYKKCCIDEDR
jgi:peptide deformylase